MRASGILMPVFSLPGPFGIGTLGKEAFAFVDFLAEAKQTYWQILPLGTTSYGDSPYQSFSAFAGNPYFIDLDLLAKAGLLQPEEYESIDWESTPDCVNYGALYQKRYAVLHKPVPACWQRPRRITPIFWRKTRSGCRTMPCSWP